MEPEFQTPSPVVKIYHDYFKISWDGNSEKEDDNYKFKNIKSLRIKSGKNSLKNLVLWRGLNLIFGLPTVPRAKQTDELVIEFKTGRTETRFLNGADRRNIDRAIGIINRKTNNFKH